MHARLTYGIVESAVTSGRIRRCGVVVHTKVIEVGEAWGAGVWA
jgi:hypothetical protein